MQAVEQRQSAKNAEAAIDEPPVEGDAADGAADEGQREHAGTGDEADFEDPGVRHGSAEWAKKKEGNDDVAEGQPVRAVGEPWVTGVHGAQAIAHGGDPEGEPVEGEGSGI